MPDSILKLASSLMRNPVEVKVDPVSSTAEKVTQALCFVPKKEKRNLLRILLLGQQKRKDSLCLVFSRTKHGANKLVSELDRAGVRSNAIHGNKSQGARQRALDEFKAGKTRILIATDVAARGIDVKGVTLVVNYDMPVEPEAYVHRIGRTARAGAEGRALSFCCEEELKELSQIERLIQQSIPVDVEQPYHSPELQESYESSRNQGASRGKSSSTRRPSRPSSHGRPRGRQSLQHRR